MLSDAFLLDPARLDVWIALRTDGVKGSGVISKFPDSIFDMSRMPLTTDSR